MSAHPSPPKHANTPEPRGHNTTPRGNYQHLPLQNSKEIIHHLQRGSGEMKGVPDNTHQSSTPYKEYTQEKAHNGLKTCRSESKMLSSSEEFYQTIERRPHPCDNTKYHDSGSLGDDNRCHTNGTPITTTEPHTF